MRVSILIACCACACSAQAQVNTFTIEVSNAVSPNHPLTTITVWAAFDPDQYAYYLSSFDVLASSDSGGFISQEALIEDGPPVLGQISDDGDAITGISVLQIHFPIGGVFADTSNPIALWRAVWTTDDFSPRTVNITAVALEFWLYTDNGGSAADFVDSFAPGNGVINVVPAPSAAALVMCTMGGWGRRRSTLA